MTEFDDVIRRLEAERPQASPRELDEIKQRVRRRAADPSRKGSQSMKSRFAILAMLVTGMLLSTAGAGLALQGDNASVAQYGTPECTPTPTPPGGGVSPAETPQGGGGGGTDVCEEGGVLPAEENSPGGENNGGGEAPAGETGGGVQPAEENQAQAERQVAAQAETSQLPMTGFAAIPVLVGGLALLAGGLILRRRTTQD